MITWILEMVSTIGCLCVVAFGILYLLRRLDGKLRDCSFAVPNSTNTQSAAEEASKAAEREKKARIRKQAANDRQNHKERIEEWTQCLANETWTQDMQVRAEALNELLMTENIEIRELKFVTITGNIHLTLQHAKNGRHGDVLLALYHHAEGLMRQARLILTLLLQQHRKQYRPSEKHWRVIKEANTHIAIAFTYVGDVWRALGAPKNVCAPPTLMDDLVIPSSGPVAAARGVPNDVLCRVLLNLRMTMVWMGFQSNVSSHLPSVGLLTLGLPSIPGLEKKYYRELETMYSLQYIMRRWFFQLARTHPSIYT